MSTTTIVEDYIFAAMREALLEALEDGTIGATVPVCPGLVALGADVHECYKDLYVLLEEWVGTRLEQGDWLPIIDGIDLNTETDRVLASYRPALTGESEGEFFATTEEFEAALDRYGSS